MILQYKLYHDSFIQNVFDKNDWCHLEMIAFLECLWL